MIQFSYIAKESSGRSIKGREFAASERELVMRLARKNLTIISIKRVNDSGLLSKFIRQRKPLNIFDQMLLCKQLATLLKGGIPLLRGLDVIESESKNSSLRSTLAEITDHIRQGDTFSSSLKKLGDTFSDLFISIAEAGEKVGALDKMLERLAKYLALRDRINKKIISAMAYPSAVLAFFFFAIGVMTLFLIPKFKALYSSFGANLPPLTLAVFGISDFILRYIIFIAAFVIACITYIRVVLLRTRAGRYYFDKFLLGIPIFGGVLKKASISKFARTLSTLLAQGIPVPESLGLVGKTAGNAIIEEACAKSSRLIVDGENIPDAFRKTGIFPSLVVQMSLIGTESGNLPELLEKTADFYEDEVDTFIAIMSSLIEPVLIVILGAVLGVFIVALYLPIFKMSSAMSGGMR